MKQRMIANATWALMLVGCGAAQPAPTVVTPEAQPGASAGSTSESTDLTSGAPGTRGLNLVSTATGEAASARAAPPSAGLQLLARITAQHAGQSVEVRDGATLRSGDRLALSVSVDRAAWVYLAYVDGQGQPAILYPTNGQGVRVQPGEMVRVPPPGLTIELDANPGEEHLMVIATERPLEQSDPTLHAAVSETLSASSEPPTGRAIQDAPSAATQGAPVAAPATRANHGDRLAARPRNTAGGTLVAYRTRGVRLTRDSAAPEEGAGLRLAADTEGVVAWRIDFHHAP